MTSVSSFTIQGMTSFNSVPADITFLRARSFPACCYTDVIKKIPLIPRWASVPPPKDGCDTKLQLGERISDERIGLVYSVDVLDITRATSNDTLRLDLSPQLCVKIVKERHALSLARETWFYEQIAQADGIAGVVSPRCFGFIARLKKFVDSVGNPVARAEPWAQCEP